VGGTNPDIRLRYHDGSPSQLWLGHRHSTDTTRELPMQSGVSGRKIAFLATDGVEQSELAEPWDALSRAGAVLHLVSVRSGEIQAVSGDEPAGRFAVDRLITEARAGEYDGLVLPGGVANPDRLRMNRDAVAFVRAFMDADKPVAAICHGPWLLVEADAVRGRSLTSWPSLQTDIRNAGGLWVDRAVETDQRLVTSRKPEDLPAFNAKVLQLFSAAIDERRQDFVVEQSFPASDAPPGPGSRA
jgi:protease I